MKKVKLIPMLISIIILVSITILWIIGLLPLWFKGIIYVADNTDKYIVTHEFLNERYYVTINLTDLESNKGEFFYYDGKNKISIDSVDKVDGVYRVGFKSTGSYTLNGAELISGLKHSYTEGIGFSYENSAEVVVEYNGFEYKLNVMGNGPTDKHGDYFSFYLLSDDIYEDNKFILEENGKVELIIYGLCKNIWTRK